MPPQQVVLGQLDSHMQQSNLDTDIAPCTQINSEWTLDLHVKHKTVKLLEDKIGGRPEGLRDEDAFLGATPQDKMHERSH